MFCLLLPVHFMYQCGADRSTVIIRVNQQARPGNRRVGNRGDQLGVIGHAHALVGIGPGPVKHEFTVGIVLQIERHGTHQPAVCILGKDMAGQPAKALTHTIMPFQRRQELVASEGMISPRHCIPGSGRDVRYTIDDPGQHQDTVTPPLPFGNSRRQTLRPSLSG